MLGWRITLAAPGIRYVAWTTYPELPRRYGWPDAEEVLEILIQAFTAGIWAAAVGFKGEAGPQGLDMATLQLPHCDLC